MIEIVRSAGEIMRTAHCGAEQVTKKTTDKDFVTFYDVKTQKYLVQEFTSLLPQAKFMCEENSENHSDPMKSGEWFIIDPIDGTANFIKGMGHSAVSVALCRDGELEIGIVYNPFSNELFYAEKGKGAYLNGERIYAHEGGMKSGFGLLGTSPYHEELADKTFAIGKMMFKNMMDIRRSGSAALDVCYTACGRAAVFCELDLCVWDFAAGALIVREAGGDISQVDGSELELKSHISVLSGGKRAREEFTALYNKNFN